MSTIKFAVELTVATNRLAVTRHSRDLFRHSERREMQSIANGFYYLLVLANFVSLRQLKNFMNEIIS